MNSYLFTLALGVQDRPERWGSVSGYYLCLAHSLRRLGHRVVFAINPKVRCRKGFAVYECHQVANHAALNELLSAEDFTHAFIWGGVCKRIAKPGRVLRLLVCGYSFPNWAGFPRRARCISIRKVPMLR